MTEASGIGWWLPGTVAMTRCGSVPGDGGPRTAFAQGPGPMRRVRDQRLRPAEHSSCGAIARRSRQLTRRTGWRISVLPARTHTGGRMPYHRSTSIALLLATILVLPAAPVTVGSGSGRVATGTIGSGPVERVVVRWFSTAATERGLSRAVRMSATHAGTRRAAVVSGDTDAWWLPKPLSGASLLATLADIAATPGVAEVAVDRRLTADLVPNDTWFAAYQWDMGSGYGVDATTAWDTTTGSAGTVVAVLDTGITTHSELTGRVAAGYDFISDTATANDGNGRDADPSDPGDWVTQAESDAGSLAGCPVGNSTWHGTHVAGTIAALGNNGTGVAGLAWGARVQPVRVLGKCGGWSSDIAAAIRWAAGGTWPACRTTPPLPGSSTSPWGARVPVMPPRSRRSPRPSASAPWWSSPLATPPSTCRGPRRPTAPGWSPSARPRRPACGHRSATTGPGSRSPPRARRSSPP